MQPIGGENNNMKFLFDFNLFSKTANGFSFEQEEKIDHLGNRTVIKRLKFEPKKKKKN